ncbi:hypothetical protein DPM19_28850 [Actinomadura craniellae]|uniref:Metalloprotease n=1 Tax=Actinomadura craniellae TaxID=2231787 RepID=A0A365GXZ7_9ACTN|nr:protealysin inhibitor emfourin [Actinomadura craniellae]RAY11638.1 hypothetical protein DPM19_28850 [Actinomadura craniellae]
MRVKIERSGGFAGLTQVVADYDTDDLPPAEAESVRQALAALAGGTEPHPVGADLYTYRITADGETYDLSEDPSRVRATPLGTLLAPGG